MAGVEAALASHGALRPRAPAAAQGMAALKSISRMLCSSPAAASAALRPSMAVSSIPRIGSHGRYGVPAGIVLGDSSMFCQLLCRDFSSASSRRWFRRKGKNNAVVKASDGETEESGSFAKKKTKSAAAKPQGDDPVPAAKEKRSPKPKDQAPAAEAAKNNNNPSKKNKNKNNDESKAANREDAAGILQAPAKVAKAKVVKNVEKDSKKQSPTKKKEVLQPATASTAEDQQNGAATKGKVVVVVESPAKAKTIEKYLGSNYVVVASYGHIRDLAARSGSVRPQDDFDLVWEVPDAAKSRFNQIKTAFKGAAAMILASDPDREGEAIAWHISEMIRLEGLMKKGVKIQRVTFNEITKSAVLDGIRSPRKISQQLVDAYLARRALDYLIGFDISPLLWRKLPGSKSAGRVQSAALCLVADREKEIESFDPREYWSVEAEIAPEMNPNLVFPARLVSLNGSKLDQFSLSSSDAEAASIFIAGCSSLKVESVKNTVARKNPPAPYTTSSLQQDASSKLGFGASKTMLLAQKLYEGVKMPDGELVGLITYMRTDSTQMSTLAVDGIRKLAEERYGKSYVAKTPRKFPTKAKNAQEAHEAIRPTEIGRVPAEMAKVLEDDAMRLYALIWRRAMASQLEAAVYNQVALDVDDPKNTVKLRSTASSVSFPGYQIVYKDRDAGIAIDDEEHEECTRSKLPNLKPGSSVAAIDAKSKQHFTDPPPRFTEGTLVKKMEELGIGRPSTYAHILKTLQLRQYMLIEKQRIFPRIRGRMVAAFLSAYFAEFVDYGFTAKMEEQLDSISSGSMKWKELLQQFWPGFHDKVTSTAKIPNQQVADMLAELFSDKLAGKDKTCPNCQTGQLQLKLTKFGTGYFLGCSGYPSCHYSNSLDKDDDDEEEECGSPVAKARSKVLGTDAATGLPVLYKEGPYGDYVQIGEDTKGKLKPKRVRVPECIDYNNFTVEMAMELMKYPKELGKDSEGKPVVIGIGRFGCYIRREGYSVFVPRDEKVEELTLEKAVDIFLKGKEDRRKVRKPPAKIAFA